MLKTFLELPYGIPSQDTFEDVYGFHDESPRYTVNNGGTYGIPYPTRHCLYAVLKTSTRRGLTYERLKAQLEDDGVYLKNEVN